MKSGEKISGRHKYGRRGDCESTGLGSFESFLVILRNIRRKEMNLRKTLCLILGLVMALFIFAGCQKEEAPAPDATTAPAATTQEAAEATATPEPEDPYLSMDNTLELTWIGLNGTEIEDENYVQKMLEDKFNVKLANTKIDVNNDEQVNLMLAAGDMADAGFMYEEPIDMYDNALIRTIPVSFMEKYAPDYVDMLNQYPIGWKLHVSPDAEDEYMALTGLSLSLENLTVVSIYRYDWLQALDVVPDVGEIKQLDEEGRVFFAPESPTFEELDAILHAFVQGDPDGDGQNNTIGFGGWGEAEKWCWTVVEGMFGFNDGYSIMTDGQLYEWNISPEYKAYLKQMASWYADGVLDPEFVTLNKNKWWEKISSNIIGWWASPFGYIDDEASSFQTRPPMSLLNNSPDSTILVTAPEFGPTGERGSRQWSPVSALNYKFFVGAEVDDEELARILMMFDWMSYDQEGVVLTRWGVAGETFDWAGEAYNSKPLFKEGYGVGGKDGFQYYNHAIYNEAYTPYQYGSWAGQILPFMQNEGREIKILPYKYDYFGETAIKDVEKQYGESMDTIRDEFFFAAITGEIDIDAEWDNYVQTWMDAGGTQYMAELEKAPVVADIRSGN